MKDWERIGPKLNRWVSLLVALGVAVSFSSVLFAWKIPAPAPWSGVLMVGLYAEGVAIFFGFAFKSFYFLLHAFAGPESPHFHLAEKVRPVALACFLGCVGAFGAGVMLMTAFALRNFLF